MEYKFPFDMGQFPFIYRVLTEPNNDNGIPNSLPFSLIYDTDTGVLMQQFNYDTGNYLEKVYEEGSMIAGNLELEGIGREYTDNFIKFIQKALQKDTFENTSFLDVGCGVGYLLHRLKLLGANVLGIEPGKHGQVGADKYQVPIICDNFPSPKIQGKFDAILLTNVLEHLQQPVEFLRIARTYLNKGGVLLIIVEDEEPYLKNGDISILFHEHYSYFTSASLTNTLLKGGASSVRMEKSDFSQLLMSASKFEEGPNNTEINLREPNDLAQLFLNNYKRISDRIKDYITDATANNKSLGIYVPARAINYLSQMNINYNNIRFFDDNSILYKTYYPGFNIHIESMKEITDSPPDKVLIMSRSFGKKIKNKLVSLIGKHTEIRIIDEFDI